MPLLSANAQCLVGFSPRTDAACALILLHWAKGADEATAADQTFCPGSKPIRAWSSLHCYPGFRSHSRLKLSGYRRTACRYCSANDPDQPEAVSKCMRHSLNAPSVGARMLRDGR